MIFLRLALYHDFIFQYQLYNGIEENPDAAGSGLINFRCSKRCPTDCESVDFEFWNNIADKFEPDPSLKLKCIDDGMKTGSGKHAFLNGYSKYT